MIDRRGGMRTAFSLLACSFALVGGATACSSSDTQDSPRAEAAPAARVQDRDWQRADPRQSGLDVRGAGEIYVIGEMRGVIAEGRGFVAVGQANQRAAAWTSIDGLTWERADVEEATPRNSGRSTILDVALGRGGFVGVGFEQGRRGSRAAVWTAGDGRRWKRVPHQSAFGTGVMNAVAAGGPGFVAGGLADYDHDPDTANAALWTSRDGQEWHRVAHGKDLFRVAGTEGIHAVTAGRRGLVAAGSDGGKIAVWRSSDGATWSRLRHNGLLFGRDQVMWSLVARAAGFVAVGYQDRDEATDGGHAVVWTSRDGARWSRKALRQALRTSFEAVAARGATLIAVGTANNAGFDAAVWTSNDGEQWRQVRAGNAVFGGPGNQLAYGVAIGNKRVVVVGADYWNGPRPAAWSASRASGSAKLSSKLSDASR